MKHERTVPLASVFDMGRPTSDPQRRALTETVRGKKKPLPGWAPPPAAAAFVEIWRLEHYQPISRAMAAEQSADALELAADCGLPLPAPRC